MAFRELEFSIAMALRGSRLFKEAINKEQLSDLEVSTRYPAG